MKVVGYIISNRTSGLILSLFTKVSLVFSYKLTKVACFQNFLLTQLDFCGNLSQQFNITYLLRVSARLPKEPEQVFNFLSLHNEPEPRPSRKGWSGSGCCVAIFYCQIQHRTLKTAWPSAWDTRRWPRKGEPENAAGRGQEVHAGRTAHPISTGQNGQLMWWMTQSVISQKGLLRYGSPHVDILSTRGELPQPKSMWTNCPHWFYPCYGWPQLDILSSHGEIWWILLFSTYQIAVTWSLCARLREP